MKWLDLFIGLSGLCGVAMGAVGAHLVHDAAAIALIEKASFYQLIHTVALLALRNGDGKILQMLRGCWAMGITLFCGSLYMKAFSLAATAPLAPFGGVLLMAGWVCIVLFQYNRK